MEYCKRAVKVLMHWYREKETIGYALYIRMGHVKKLNEEHRLNSAYYLLFHTLV